MWLVAFLLFVFSTLTAKEVPFTLEDREGITRLEEGQKVLIQKIESTKETLGQGIEDKIDDVISIMLWSFGVLFAGMMTLIGLVIWDRRTAVKDTLIEARLL